MVEKTDGFKPLTFYSGIGMVLEGFENGILKHADDGSFDFTLSPSEAYGEYDADGVMASISNSSCAMAFSIPLLFTSMPTFRWMTPMVR